MNEAPLAHASFFYRFFTAACVSSFLGSGALATGAGVANGSTLGAAAYICGYGCVYYVPLFMKSNWKEGAGAWVGTG